MNIQTGDIVMLAPAKGKESFFQRAIQTMGSVSTHNELIYVDDEKVPYVGCASPPYFKLIPLSDRIADCRNGTSNMLIARWKDWPVSNDISPRYAAWQGRVALGVLLLAEKKDPYDKTAIRSIVRNMIRGLLGWKLITKQKESAIYCTENVEIITRLAGTFLFGSIPKQTFYAPIHVERILRLRELNQIADFGLRGRL